MSTKTCSNNMVSLNDHVVMNHQNQTPNKWHMRPCSLHKYIISCDENCNFNLFCLYALRLTFHGLFFKGHYESLGSLNRGNFLEMFKLLALYNEIVMENASKKCKIHSS
jgi:hypothetical protein